MTLRYSTDIVIFGGGVAGLWLLNRLRQAGYNALLLESETLGGGQTLASQGIIHGGLKYALGGVLTGASQAIAEMPARWRAALRGEGDLDLSAVKTLSDHYYMWSNAGLRSRFKTFLGSKSLRGRIDAVPPAEYPAFFKAATVAGNLYRLPDFVVDTPSLLATLSVPVAQQLLHYDAPSLEFTRSAEGSIQQADFTAAGQQVAITARQFILTAGEGNKSLLEKCGLGSVQTQLRPLKMVHLTQPNMPEVYVHCIGDDFSMKPALTVTTHPQDDGSATWYLGGQLAEAGVEQSDAEVIADAKKQLASLFPWLDVKAAQWGCFLINRAEIAYDDNNRPDDAAMLVNHNVISAWPTKLTLAPVLADKILSHLQSANVVPGIHDPSIGELTQQLSSPVMGQPRWGSSS